MLNIVGIGLRGLKSITLEEAEIIEKCDIVYFERYTSIAPEETISSISTHFEKEVIPVERDFIENTDHILTESREKDVCLLVVGDGLTATTHNELRYDAIKRGIGVRIYENSSILTVVAGKLGLFPYKMGPPVSLPFVSEKFFPMSVYDKIEKNLANGFHTLLLLDLKDNETLGVQSALKILRMMEDKGKRGIITDSTSICIATKVSQPGEMLICDSFSEIEKKGTEGSPSSIVILSNLNDSEQRFVSRFSGADK